MNRFGFLIVMAAGLCASCRGHSIPTDSNNPVACGVAYSIDIPVAERMHLITALGHPLADVLRARSAWEAIRAAELPASQRDKRGGFEFATKLVHDPDATYSLVHSCMEHEDADPNFIRYKQKMLASH